ncbi:Detected protein of confused Function [Hibiscus syriacus]|uniref:Detected protein of confused Function n=1 Tax=Hibiscus syriacus TaxID=106335 RepID=A0A6A2Z3D2_HIBSY|nr:uncharacterized protein LOC120151883 [Hibiscus syriacus]KAE8686237.1 Detected protein of confused Function [Hibiscus syriacus]
MMDMKENQKLDSASSYEDSMSEEKISTQKISVLDHTNGFQYTTTDKSDSFVIDMESFSHGGFNDEINPNPRITRNLSRKGSQRDNKKTTAPGPSSSPKGSCMPQKPTVVVAGTTDPATNQQVHHQITITTGSIAAATESRFSLKRNGCRRPPTPWLLDPKRVLMLFATLSSIGSILLIFFTLSMSKTNGDESGLG